LNHAAENQLHSIVCNTQILIAPGYPFQIVDILITNFHQPQSTLLLLIAAFLDEENNWRSIYQHALDNNYRFLSYGDSSILFSNNRG
jgi:S-adenosylmethionine:tRNA ribosyltransferase-isomerase